MNDKPYPALCKDCKWSSPEPGFEWNLRCHQPTVNADDPWALASGGGVGTRCQSERGRATLLARCGKGGKLWEARLVLSPPLSGNSSEAK